MDLKELQKLLDGLDETDNPDGFTVIELDPGDRVFCDVCGQEYTDSDVSGGILFVSKAVCPTCMKEVMPDIKKYGETHLIKAECPSKMTFAEWVRSIRL